MLTIAGVLDQVKAWQDIFGGGPLAAFVGVLLCACMFFLGLYVRANRALLAEKDSHIATIRTSERLAGAMERTWSDYLAGRERDVDLQRQTLAALQLALSKVETRT